MLAGFRADVLALLKGFDVFVMSSVTEGLGTSLLDAMACREARSWPRGPAASPRWSRTGSPASLVPPRDAASLAEAIVGLLTDAPLRERMGRAGFERVSARFSVERMVEGTLDVYNSLTGSPRAARAAEAPPTG